MSINDSKIEFIEDDRLTDLAGGSLVVGGLKNLTGLASVMDSNKRKTMKNCLKLILERSCFSGGKAVSTKEWDY